MQQRETLLQKQQPLRLSLQQQRQQLNTSAVSSHNKQQAQYINTKGSAPLPQSSSKLG
jgi:hypothetical protein